MTTFVDKKVQQFYNKTPFPDYELERFSTKTDLITAANSFAKLLDRSIPADASIIDVGTGTGQLILLHKLAAEATLHVIYSHSFLF